MKKTNLINREHGLTLIEVIASIVLISIILLSFMGMFLQTSKTTATSDDIVNATYIAQKEMESIYEYRNDPIETVLETQLDYNNESTSENSITWVKTVDAVHIYVTLKQQDNLGLTPIIIEVKEDMNIKCKIENRYKLNLGG
ncbi:prepilin-type N-terminal cleavage/methylation domain-containing protein [Lysinibacillus sp. JK80]|uniref:type IV pilus modification PilV family protein n=1 Tax=Lysinibacillus sp. JK80 TaxID=2749809 RepID=UPI0022B98C67|nr:prepilin-type N-terminal cleavage/methylation domain-containing protein [Lysinibacillus sp. JK80]WBF56089.1 prepilin-type N-terminal cleavage/methylation domain-containing protein [Lysinibacillus sp. JK80]